MTAEEILEKVNEYLDQHLKRGAPKEALSQDPHKTEFFELFREAYRKGYFDKSFSPQLSGDALYKAIVERWDALW